MGELLDLLIRSAFRNNPDGDDGVGEPQKEILAVKNDGQWIFELDR
jgi:hypothetical protein